MDRIILGLVVVVGVPAATVGYVWAFEWVLGRMSYTAAAKIRPWDKAIPLLLAVPDALSLVAESIPPSSTRWRILRSLRMNAEARRGRTSQWMGHMTANPRD